MLPLRTRVASLTFAEALMHYELWPALHTPRSVEVYSFMVASGAKAGIRPL